MSEDEAGPPPSGTDEEALDEGVPGEIPYDDIAHFIVQVRQIVSQTYPKKSDYDRAFRRIKNLSTRLYRDHIGYTPEGAYRLKRKYERTFTEGIEGQGGREDVLADLSARNPMLAKILRGQQAEAKAVVETSEPPAPPVPVAAGSAAPEVPMPEWAEDFDPDAVAPVGVTGAKTAPLVDLDSLSEEDLKLEIVSQDSEQDPDSDPNDGFGL